MIGFRYIRHLSAVVAHANFRPSRLPKHESHFFSRTRISFPIQLPSAHEIDRSWLRLILQVDFQLSNYTSPAIDLLYFLSTSPSLEAIENNKDVLLDEYLNTLSSIMKQLGCKTQPPTMEKLKDSLKERAAYGMIASFTVLPIVICEKSAVKDIDEIMSKDGSFENPGYKGKLYRKIMTKRIPIYDEMGLLDYWYTRFFVTRRIRRRRKKYEKKRILRITNEERHCMPRRYVEINSKILEHRRILENKYFRDKLSLSSTSSEMIKSSGKIITK